MRAVAVTEVGENAARSGLGDRGNRHAKYKSGLQPNVGANVRLTCATPPGFVSNILHFTF